MIPDKAPTKCLACEDMFDDSKPSIEHVFNRALGGTKKSKKLYCRSCNPGFSTDVDAPFAEDFAFITTVLNVKRDRKPPPPHKVITTAGEKLYLGPGGAWSPQAPASTLVEERDGARHITITMPTNQPKLYADMLEKVAKEYGFDPAAPGRPSITFATSPGPVNGNVKFASIGGPVQARAIAKIALGFLALEIGDDVFTEPYAALRLAVVQGKEVRAWPQPPFRALETPKLPRTDGVQHRVLIYTTESATWAHVEVYGTFGYAVLLADVPDARFSLPYVWGQNPTTGERGEGRAQGALMPTPAREQAEPTAEDFACLLKVILKVVRCNALERVVEEEFAIAGDRTGEELSHGDWEQLCRWMAARAAALLVPSAPHNLSRSVGSADELQRVGRALCSVSGGKKRRKRTR